MRKPLFKDFFRELRHTLGRFMAIFGIVALGVGFFAGLKATSPDMNHTGDVYFDNNGLYDVYLLSTMGFTQEDIDAIRGVDGVSSLMPAYNADVIIEKDESEAVLRLHSIPLSEDDQTAGGEINLPVLKEGRFPQKSGECVVDSYQLHSLQLEVGDTFTLSEKTGQDTLDGLKTHTYTVVGVVDSPMYISLTRGNTSIGSGSIDYFVLIPEVDFDMPVYTEVYALLEGAKELDSFSDEYDQFVDEKTTLFEDLGAERCDIRYREITDEARQQIADAQQEIEDGQKELDSQLAEAESTLNAKEKELSDGQQQLEAARDTLAEKQAELNSGQQQYEAGLAELEANRTSMAEQKQLLDEMKAGIDSGRADYQEGLKQADQLEQMGQVEAAEKLRAQLALMDQKLTEMEQQYSGYMAEYEAGLQQFEAAEQTLQQTAEQLKNGWNEISAASAVLDETQAELESGRSQLDAAWEEYRTQKAEGQQKLDDARAEVEDAEAELAKVSRPEWYVLDRDMNVGVASFQQDVERVDRVAVVFPVFFFLVAALVCLTTMTRMVEEQRVQIGTMKALGYSKAAISMKYLYYAALAGVLGSIAGLTVGYFIFPTVIWNAYTMMYTMPPIIIEFNIPYAVISSAAALICTLVSTFAAVYAELASTPAALMRPKAPKAGKRVIFERIGPLWRRLSFTKKVTLRNLMRYKKRFFMTVLGVGGCTALMLAGFGLKDSIGDIITKQYDEIYNYSVIGTLSEPVTGRDGLDASAVSDSRIENSMLSLQEAHDVYSDTAMVSTYLFVPENTELLGQFINLRTRVGHEALEMPDENGVVISEKMAKLLNVGVGDTIRVERDDGVRVPLTINGICENYVYHYLYISPELYEQQFGAAPEFSTVNMMLQDGMTDEDEDAFAESLLENSSYTSVSFTSDTGKAFSDVLTSLDAVILVLIVCSALLSYVVLYNLTNINVTERLREIATIKVLGFYDREVAAYVYRENLLLTLIGTVAGLVIGVFLHAFVVDTAEVDIVMFGRDIKLLSFIFSVVLTMVFAALVDVVMYRKLKNISMVESLKSVE